MGSLGAIDPSIWWSFGDRGLSFGYHWIFEADKGLE